MHWKAYQLGVVEQLKEEESKLVVTGDAHHDSMGHNAKFGVYTIYCCDNSKIIDFSVVQVRLIC